MNRAEEDYIKTIYELTVEKKQPMIKSNEIADRFGFTDQSVNEMIKKLEKKHLVSFIPYKGISLTKKGKDVAIRMIRSHRIWEVFLTEKLGFSWENVHEDAEMLEHATSPAVLEKLYHFLGEPAYCQHGNPIPLLNGKMEDAISLSLAELSLGDQFELYRVLDHRELLVYLNTLGIKLHDRFTVVSKDAFNGLITLKRSDQIITLTLKTASMLFGKIVNS
ncbi:MAG TPA: metal-dependent transcriptional regulator [Acholeplasmataceae bacterium]|jgi:DtxR family Mn-dependent transcriptional regulator|nr:metal-dependent transcriptional regulator [Acholeplasmataceae bacterium]